MTSLFKIATALLLFVGVPCAAGQSIELPSDPTIPVVELWYVDQGQVREPEVAVFANGRVRVNVGEGALWGELTVEQVQNLVSCLLKQDGIQVIRTETIQQELEAASQRTGLSCVIERAGDTIIRVRTATEIYRVDGHAVGLLSTRFPDCGCLQRLYSAQCRLENIRAIVMAGGLESAKRLAKLAEQQLQADFNETVVVTPAQLSMVRTLADGTRFSQFLIPSPTKGLSNAKIITVFESPGEVPRIGVLPDGPTYQ